MRPTLFTLPKRSPPARLAAKIAFALSLPMLGACSMLPASEPPVIGRKPQLTPRPASVSQIDRQPSTEALQRAGEWLQNSGELLSDEMPR